MVNQTLKAILKDLYMESSNDYRRNSTVTTLYHYGSEKYSQLSSLYARKKEKEGFKSILDDPYAYNKHISFFLEPVPDNLPSILNNEHEFWAKGRVVYEHRVNIDSLPEDVFYRIVETHAKTDLIFNHQDWEKVARNPKLKSQYLRQIKDLEELNGYRGQGLDKLKKVIKTLPYDIAEDFANLYKFSLKYPEDDFLAKYAANVPHLMAYVGLTPLVVDKVNKRILR